MIVMFNLLIAIISETFAKVNENAEQAGYQERASLINENLFLIPKSYSAEFYQEDNFMFRAVNMDSNFANDDEDDTKKSLEEIT